MRLTTAILRGIQRMNKKNNYLFSEQKQKSNLFGFIKKAWQQTFPDEQQQIRNKYQNVKQQKHYTKQQIQKLQSQIPQYTRTALTETKVQAKQEKAKFKIANIIPQSIKKKITDTQTFKEVSGFKQNLKEYISTRDGAVANAASLAYGTVTNQSPMARATTLMRKFMPDFSIFQLQRQSTVIFKDAYNTFLCEDLEKLQKIANQQAFQYFKAHIKLNKTKKQKPKYTQLVHHRAATLKKANVGQKLLPTFQFSIIIMQIYCMVDAQDKVVDGDLQRVNQTMFQFVMTYSGNHLDANGHPWEIIEIKKIQEMKLLV